MNTVHQALLAAFLGCLAGAISCVAQPAAASLQGGPATEVLTVTNAWSATGLKPGGQITLALVLSVKKPFHINANKTKDAFIPTTVELVNAPPELQSSTPIFPEPTEIEFGVGTTKEKIAVFSERAVVYIPMSVTSAAKPGDLDFQVKVSYQACDDKTCLFPTEVVSAAILHVAAPNEEVREVNSELFASLTALRDRLDIAFFGWDFKIEASNFLLLLIVAAIGGTLLNFTPCVLPLIPIKIMGLSRAAGNRRRCLLLGLSLSVGVVAFWLALVICAMAVGMCGLFAVSLPQSVYRINPSQESMGGSFVFGIMTAVLSTPCTAPFMGAAAAWAATQRPLITLTTFGAIGLGMALPYFLLSAFPALVHRMPRTGPASDLIKQVMGLFMLAAGAYFLGTGLAGLLAKPPDPPTQAYWWFVAFFIAAGGVWMAWRTFQITPRWGRRLVFGGLGMLFLISAIGLGVRFTRGSPIQWIYYTPERLAAAQQQKKIVVLEFTAAWCLNCHALEQAVLHDPKVVALLNGKDVAPLKIDITGNNLSGSQKLIEVGRRTIPYLIVYSPEGKQLFASDAYTVEQLTAALGQAAAAL